MNINKPKAVRRLEADLFALVGQMMSLTLGQRKAVIVLFTELLRPHVLAPTMLHEVLQEAAKRSGLVPPRQRHIAVSTSLLSPEKFSARRTWLSVGFWYRTYSNNCGPACAQGLLPWVQLRQLSVGLIDYRLNASRR